MSALNYRGFVMCLPGTGGCSVVVPGDDLFPMRNNPLGAFVGMVFSVNYTYRTVQHPVLNSFKLKARERAAAPEAVRDMLRVENHDPRGAALREAGRVSGALRAMRPPLHWAQPARSVRRSGKPGRCFVLPCFRNADCRACGSD